MRKRRWFVLATALVVFSMVEPVAQAIQGFFFIGTGRTDDKPQSKLWYHDGVWWGIFPDGGGIYFYRIMQDSLVKQTFPDAMVDDRNSARADVLSHGDDLFVLMYKGSKARLSKYRYDAASQRYTRLPGFPLNITLTSGSESAVIALDTTGKLWLAYEAGNSIRVRWSTHVDHTAMSPSDFIVYSPVGSDDIASVVSFNNAIGVLWSDQTADNFAFRVHLDSAPEDVWEPVEIAAQGGGVADDHLNLAVTTTHDVLAAVKTRSGSNRVELFVRWFNEGWNSFWDGPYVVTEQATRPIVVFDAENEQVYVFYTDWSVSTSQGTIVYKVAPLNSLTDFNTAEPLTVLSGSGMNFNDVTSTKHVVDSYTGVMVAATEANGDSAHYKLVEIVGLNTPPVATAQAAVTTGYAPLSVAFTGTGVDTDGSVISYDWSFGDGTTSDLQHPTHTYVAPGTYEARLTVMDDSGATTDATVTITVLFDPALDDIAPRLTGQDPSAGSTDVSVHTAIVVQVEDGETGVAAASMVMRVNEVVVQPMVTGSPTAYQLTYIPSEPFNHAQIVTVEIEADDRAEPVNHLSASYSFTTSPLLPDVTAPLLSGHNPAPGAAGVTVDTAIAVQLEDAQSGVAPTSIVMRVNGVVVPPTITGTPAAYLLTYVPPVLFAAWQTVSVQVEADDQANPPNHLVASYSFSTGPPPVTGPLTTLEAQVAASQDDAEQETSGSMGLASADLDLGMRAVGLRFQLAVPAGATITTAYVQFTADESDGEVTSLIIQGEATDDAQPFVKSSYNITNRARTSASVAWEPAAWTSGSTDVSTRTPELAMIIQELVNRPGWGSGQAIGLIFTGSGHRSADAFNGDPAQAPFLHVEYAAEPVEDATAPALAGYDPLPGAVEVSVHTAIVVQVTDTGSGVASESVELQVDGVVVQPTISGSPFAYTLTYIPSAPFAAAQEITVSVEADDRAEPANHLSATYSFTTAAPAVDVTAPVLAGHDPAPGAVDVSVHTAIVVQVVDAQSGVAQESIVLRVNNLVVQPAVSGNAGAYTLTYTPSEPFAAGQEVTVAVEADDQASPANHLSASYSFTTAAEPPTGPSSIIDVRVIASADDAEEKAGGSVSLTSPDLELVYDGNNQTVGLRFQNVTIPAGATIITAYVQFTVDEQSTAATSLVIEGQATLNPTTFSASSRDVSNRPRTNAAVAWIPVAWATVGEAAEAQRTPNLAAIVQELVNQPGWSSGQALVLLITGTGERVAEAYDGEVAKAPLLHVEYAANP